MAAATVALTITIAVWVYFPVRQGNAPIPVMMAAGAWNGTTCTVDITGVRQDVNAGVAQLRYEVKGNATVYFAGAAGEGAPVNGVTITISFVDGGTAGLLDGNDSIVVAVGGVDQLTALHRSLLSVFDPTGPSGTYSLASVTLQ